MRIVTATTLALLLACVPVDDFELDAAEEAEELRALGPSVCMQSLSECRVDYHAPCTPQERDVCETPYHMACTELAALCELQPAGSTCPSGWWDPCDI